MVVRYGEKDATHRINAELNGVGMKEGIHPDASPTLSTAWWCYSNAMGKLSSSGSNLTFMLQYTKSVWVIFDERNNLNSPISDLIRLKISYGIACNLNFLKFEITKT